MDSIRIAKPARQSERGRCASGHLRPIRTGLTRVGALGFVYWCAVIPSLHVSAMPHPHPGQVSFQTSGSAFVIRLRDGQTKFHQGEIITVEFGYGANPDSAVKQFAAHPDRPGLILDRLVLTPHTGVVDPLRDFLATVGGWEGPPPRSSPFVEAGGSWATADINDWFRFDNPGKYTLSALAHKVRSSYEAFGDLAGRATTLGSNTVEFEIIPAGASWQAATLRKAMGLLETKSSPPQQGCRILRFLATPQAVDEMMEHYTDQGGLCESEYRDGLFAFPNREYAVRKLEEGLREPSVAVSAGSLDTLARLSACLQRPELIPGTDEHYLGSSEWAAGGPVGLWELIEEKQDRYVQELIGALDDKVVKARALSLKAIFDSPYLGRPTLLKSNDPALVAKLRDEIAAIFTQLPVSDQMTLLYVRWQNIASPAMIPVLKHLYNNPPPGPNEQFIGFVLDDLYHLDPAEGRALVLEEMKRPRPRMDPRFMRLLPDKEIPELDQPLLANLEATDSEDDTILQLIGRYATPTIFPQILEMEGGRVGSLPCEGQSWLLIYVVKCDPVRGAAMLDKALAAHNGCSTTVLTEVASRQMTPEIERLALAHLGDSDPQAAAGAAVTLGRYGSADAEEPLWSALEKWHARWEGRGSDLPNGSGIALHNGLETALEDALIDALGSGQAWFAEPTELARLGKLCVSTGGCQKVQGIVSEASRPPNVLAAGTAESFHASVAQYHVESVDALRQKLAQYPEGTNFTWSFGGNEKEGAAILGELRTFLMRRGVTIH